MNVELMRCVVDDVERGVSPAVAKMAAERWAGPGRADRLVYVRSSANHLFRLTREGLPYYLRLSHAEERDEATVTAELDFMRHVGEAGLLVARPAPSISGRLIEDVSCDGFAYIAVVFEGLRGRELEVDDLDQDEYRAWGGALAMLHRASETFPLHPARLRWTDQAREALRSLPPEEGPIAAVIASGLEWLESLAIPELDYGLIHGDFELDNLVWDGRRVQALDFDDGAYGWYGLDVAVALHDVWQTGGEGSGGAAQELRDRRFEWFAEGYTALRPLPAELPEAMPRLLALQLAVKMARLLRAYATTTADDYLQWFEQMRARHERWLAGKRAALR